MIGKPILVACEESQMVTTALLELGYDAWSNDIKPTRGSYPERHLRMDAREALLLKDWHGLIAHPVCKGMAGSGAKHQYVNEKRFNADGTENPLCEKRTKLIDEGVEFFKVFHNSDIKVKGIENSIMLNRAKDLIGCGQQDQTSQPWWFGDKMFKGACWWLTGLPKLVKTSDLIPPLPGTQEHKDWSVCHRMPKGPDRARLRAETPPMSAWEYARQWGPFLSGQQSYGCI